MNGRFIFGLGALIVGLVLCALGLGHLLSRMQYQAVVKIRIEPDMVSDIASSGDSIPYDPYFMETELKIMVSDIVLSKVVQSLDLDEIWGKRYGGGGRIGTDKAIEWLKRRIALDGNRNTRIIRIQVIDEDPDEAVRIANAIAQAYGDYRKDQHRQQMADGIKMLEEDYQVEEVRIQAMQAQLEELKKQLNATNSGQLFELTEDSSFSQAKQRLDDEQELHQLLKAKLQSEKTDAVSPMTPLATIVEPAVPPKVSIGPSRLLDMILLLCGLVMSGFGVYLISDRSKIIERPPNQT